MSNTSSRRGQRALDAVSREVLGVDVLLKLVEPQSEAAVEQWRRKSRMPFPDRERCREELERLRRLDENLDGATSRALNIHLGDLPALERTFRRLDAGEMLRDADFFELKRFLYHGVSILEIADGLDRLPSADSELGGLLRVMMNTIHPEQAPSSRFHLADELDTSLKRCREQMRSIRTRYKQARQTLEDGIVADYGGAFDIRGRFRPDEQEAIDDERLQWDDGSYRVADDKLEALAQQLDEARREVTEEENRQRRRLTAFVKERADALTTFRQTLLDFDLRLARVKLRRSLDGCWPELPDDVDESVVSIRGGRDPVLCEVLGRDEVQPIDVELRRAGTVVLGPNMGGKSALLRLVGIAQWCAQMGFPVPADVCTVAGVDRIVYIGSEEPGRSDVTEGLSSFGREVRRFVDFWDTGDNVMWLLDEPGRGTHPEEGAGLAEEICRYRLEKGDRVVVATHFPQLADANGFTILRIAGLAIDDDELQRRMAEADDVGQSLEDVLRGCMDYSVVEADGDGVPRDARRVARALGLNL